MTNPKKFDESEFARREWIEVTSMLRRQFGGFVCSLVLLFLLMYLFPKVLDWGVVLVVMVLSRLLWVVYKMVGIKFAVLLEMRSTESDG